MMYQSGCATVGKKDVLRKKGDLKKCVYGSPYVVQYLEQKTVAGVLFYLEDEFMQKTANNLKA